MKGIYIYIDLKTGNIVYVGKDSHIDKNKRHGDHNNPNRYSEQKINQVLQNNPDRYEYSVIWITEDCTNLKLNKMEILFGKIFNPKFNFDKFGKGGSTGHTEKTKQKISESLTGRIFSEEHKENLSKSLTGKPKSKEHIEKISKTKNTSGYFRVCKSKNNNLKQGFNWLYRYSKDGKRKSILSVSIEKLEEKVKSKGLEWRKL